jgi:ABC-type antimicrobial peptide transport system permease subunit
MADVRVTLRQLRRSPSHIAACVLSLAAGMAVCVAVFSAINAMIFSPIPGVGERAHLVMIRWSNGGERSSTAEFEAIAAAATGVFGGVAAESVRVLAVSLPSGAASKAVAFASDRYFEVLRTSAVAGRLLGVRDAASGAPPAAVISELLWRDAFAADPAVLGRVIQVGGRPFTLVGIVPAGLPGLRLRDIGQVESEYPQIWLPLSYASTWMRVPSSTPWLMLQGRLRSGVSDRTAQSALAVIGGRLLQQSGGRPKDARLLGFRAGLDWSADALQSVLVLVVFLFVPMCVLAIGCANVVNLQLARATERARELTVRMALGASRARLARLLGLEVIVLASAAGLVGWRGASVLLRAMQPWFPAPLSIDRHVLV